MIPPINLPQGKKIFFISDFHLGAPNAAQSVIRERRIIAWLNEVSKDAAAIFLMGDIFDFWFEYKHVIPKGFVRLQGKLAQITDSGIPVYLFTGNHDMWMFGYFNEELKIPLFRKPEELIVNGKKFLIGHGDGLGPHDHMYKFLKKIFANKFFQWLFRITHPDVGISIANFWSRNSRAKQGKNEESFLGESEWLWTYCKEVEQKQHHDYYIFGHRHLPLDLQVGNNSRYINLGEWITHFTYASYDGQNLELKKFDKEVW